MTCLYDAVILGGGPAGASCALWLKMLGHSPLLIEKDSKLGGLQNYSPYPNGWIATSHHQTGEQIAQTVHDNILSNQIECALNSTAYEIERRDSHSFQVKINTTHPLLQEVQTRFVVLACGVQPVQANFEPSDKVFIGPGKQIADHRFKDEKVAILGGGDNAFENFHFIKSQQPAEIHIYARTIKARREFTQITTSEHISIGEYSIDQDPNDCTRQKIRPYNSLYGWAPALSFLKNLPIKLTNRGFIQTDFNTLETSEPGIYAIGEITQRLHPCVVTSMADGVTAAKAISNKLEKHA
ncbi:MAG: NAD(P)/FAD-dependent oxidoreductase [Gammaproteobacteria bacterium]